MKPILLIAADSVWWMLHRRLLVAAAVVALGITSVADLTSSELRESIFVLGTDQGGTDLGYGIVLATFVGMAELGGTLVTLLISSTAVAVGAASGVVRPVLARPVSRAELVVGRYFGAIVGIFCYSLVAGTAAYAFSVAGDLDFGPRAWLAPCLMACGNLMGGSLAVLLSLLTRPAMAAAVAFFASAEWFSPAKPLYFLLPSYDRFGASTVVMEARMLTFGELSALTLYAVDVSAIFLLLSIWRFHRMELK
ncbi:MAG: hypothetical protein OXN89_03365 [Bryobacterales bacterium]|nr:hypothetical protein [Bryobacterales bacterium]